MSFCALKCMFGSKCGKWWHNTIPSHCFRPAKSERSHSLLVFILRRCREITDWGWSRIISTHFYIILSLLYMRSWMSKMQSLGEKEREWSGVSDSKMVCCEPGCKVMAGSGASVLCPLCSFDQSLPDMSSGHQDIVSTFGHTMSPLRGGLQCDCSAQRHDNMDWYCCN